MKSLRWICCGIALMFAAGTVIAADNELTDKEKTEGWQLLFDGKTLDGWSCNNGKEARSKIEDGCLVPYKSGGYILIYDKKQFGDFVFSCDVKMGEKCNSGIFYRMEQPKDPVNKGFEVQVMTGKGTGMHDFGAIYDLAKITKNNAKGPGQWNNVVITCDGPKMKVEVNGEVVCQLNCDEFTEPKKRPDGSTFKFNNKGPDGKVRALKDFARKGYLGVQDHGHPVWYKNIKIKELNKK